MTDDEWRRFEAGFTSGELLEIVGIIDTLRDDLSDGDHHAPPEIRAEALTLHRHATRVLNDGDRDEGMAMFDLADGLELQVGDMIERLERIQRILLKLADFRGESDWD